MSTLLYTLLTVYVSLAECLALSEENSSALRGARLDVQAALEQKAEARWEYFPTVKISAGGYWALNPMMKITLQDVLGRSDYAMDLSESISAAALENGIKPYYEAFGKGYSIGASAIQPVYAGGRIVSGNRLAALGVEASELQAGIVRRKTAGEVESKYWQVVALQEKSKTLSEMEALLDSIEKDAVSAFAAGIVTENDLLQVRLRRKELESGKIRLRSGLKLAKMDLFNAVGMEYTYLGIDDFVLSDSPEGLPGPDSFSMPEEEVPQSNESQLLEMQVEGARLEKKMQVGEYLPQVGVGVGYGYGNMMGKDRDGSFNGAAFAIVQVPITDIGKAVHRARRYDAQIQKAASDREYLDAQLTLQLRKLQLDMESAWEQMQVAAEAVAVAEDSQRKQQTAFGAGFCTASDLLQTVAALRTASEEYIDRCIDYRIACSEYLRRCGK